MTPDAVDAAKAAGLTPDEVARALDNMRGTFVLHQIDPSAEIGDGTKVWHYAVVLADVRLGKDCSVGSGCEIGRGSEIGNRTRIGAHSFLPPNSQIGSAVFIGPNVTFCDDLHPHVPEPGDAPYRAEPPVVGDRAVIGAGCVILPGVHIGARAVVGAGSVVTRDVPDGAHVRGEPARTHTMSVRALGQFQSDFGEHLTLTGS